MGMSVLFSILPWGIGGYVCYPGSGLGLPSLDLFSDHPVMLPFSWVAWVLFEIGELPLSVLVLLSPTTQHAVLLSRCSRSGPTLHLVIYLGCDNSGNGMFRILERKRSKGKRRSICWAAG